MTNSLPYMFGYMIGTCVPSFLISWLILLIAKPKTRATFSTIVLITCSVLMILSLLGSKEKEFSLLAGIMAMAITYAILWAIYKKDLSEEKENVTTLNLSVSSQASFPLDNTFNPSEIAEARTISGKYLNQNNPADYIELLPDGRFYMQERNTHLAGNYKTEDGILLLTVSTGQSSKAILQSNSFTDSDGKTWARQFHDFSYANNIYYPPPVQKRSSARPIIIAIGIVIVTIITGILIRVAVTNALQPKKYSEAKAVWKPYSIQNTGLILELPGEPKQTEIALPSQARDLVRESSVSEYTKDDMSCMTMYILYKDGIVINTAGGAGGAAENLRKATGISELQYNLKPYDASRVAVNGSCKLKDDRCGIDGIFMVKGQKMWGVLTIYAEKNQEAVQAAKRIMSSVKID